MASRGEYHVKLISNSSMRTTSECLSVGMIADLGELLDGFLGTSVASVDDVDAV